jgi:N-acylneuraminate cytidylyltransferase
MNLAIIPARGGSKRIPGKNSKLFCGKPLIAYSIEAAKNSGLFDKIIVSTDSENIAQIAKEYGADIPFMRPSALADDFTGTTPVVRHAINYFTQRGWKPKFTCCIYATAPFIQVSAINQGIERLKADDAKHFAFSVTSFPFPIQRALKMQNGCVVPFQPQSIPKRSQDLEEAYHDAGQFYWGTSEAFLTGAPMFSETSIPIVLPRHLVQDIDTLEDWTRAELMYKAYIQAE